MELCQLLFIAVAMSNDSWFLATSESFKRALAAVYSSVFVINSSILASKPTEALQTCHAPCRNSSNFAPDKIALACFDASNFFITASLPLSPPLFPAALRAEVDSLMFAQNRQQADTFFVCHSAHESSATIALSSVCRPVAHGVLAAPHLCKELGYR